MGFGFLIAFVVLMELPFHLAYENNGVLSRLMRGLRISVLLWV